MNTNKRVAGNFESDVEVSNLHLVASDRFFASLKNAQNLWYLSMNSATSQVCGPRKIVKGIDGSCTRTQQYLYSLDVVAAGC